MASHASMDAQHRRSAAALPVAFAFLMAFSVPLATPVASAQGEDGTVTVTSPTNGQSVTYYTSSTPLTVSCSTSKTPQADPEFGVGMAFAIRQAGVGGFNFAQGWDSTSPYSVTRTMAQWGIANSGNHELRCRIYNGGVYYWATRTFNIVVATSGEDGSVTMTGPTDGQGFSYSTGASLAISCSTTHTPAVDPEFGAAGMAFAVRQAGVGGYNFAQGWDSTAPYSVTKTMAQWGITGTGPYEARCRVYENGLYYWSTRSFSVTQGEDGSVTMTSPTNGQGISYGLPLSIACSTTHTPAVDPEFGAAGVAFAVRQAGVGAFDFSQGWDSTAPYSVTKTMAQWGITGTGSYEARCRVHDSGLYFWSTRSFSITQGEDGSVTMTSPTSGEDVPHAATLSITCTTAHTPQSDGEHGAGIVFAVRPASTGAFDFSQGYAGTSPYTATRTLAQWGITGPGAYEARCRVYDAGLYFWSTRSFDIVVGPPGAPQGLTVSAPTYAQQRLDWSVPAYDGGASLSGYNVYGGTAFPLQFLGYVPASQLYFERQGLAPGLYHYEVNAVNGQGHVGAGASVSGRAYADYTIELRAWIPQESVVDPVVYSGCFLPYGCGCFGDPSCVLAADSYAYYGSGMASGYQPACYGYTLALAQGGPSTIDGWYQGDDHLGYDGGYRVRSLLHLTWDGATVDADPSLTSGNFGTTHLWRRYWAGDNQYPCVLNEDTVDFASSAGATGATAFNLQYASPNPVAANYPTGSFQTPDIDGSLTGTFQANGALALEYTTDQFPSHAFRVVRNGVTALTMTPTDGSCVDAESPATLKSALETSQGTGFFTLPHGTIVGTVTPTPSQAC